VENQPPVWKTRKTCADIAAFSLGNPVEKSVNFVENTDFSTCAFLDYQQFTHTGELPS